MTVAPSQAPLIRRLTIKRFRGLHQFEWLPAPGLNVILGGGDVGKTTVLEAIALLLRYPIVICDEHQDASADQHAMVMAIHKAGAALRVFGDPMQRIGKASQSVRTADAERWDDLKAQADMYDELDYPHRWERAGTKKLGEWILKARAILKEGGKIDLRAGRPPEVSVIIADNEAKTRGVYVLGKAARQPIDEIVLSVSPLLVLSAQNDTVQALRPFFYRRIPVWEGHTRDALVALANTVETCKGDCVAIAGAAVKFVQEIAIGFTGTDYSKDFLGEVASGCTAKRRRKPAILQELGRFILAEPDHRGIAKMLARLSQLIQADDSFSAIRLDHPREYHEAVLLGDFESCSEGMAEIARRRTYARPMPPQRALSTVHKAKGLERDHVLIMPCDSQHFADTLAARCLLYVAMSRATQSVTLVVPRSDPSPLLII
jgi:UvrD-like helicase C-terminal domain